MTSDTARGPYSSALEALGLIFLSGQGGLDPHTGEPVDGGIRAETRQTLENIERLLTEAGLGLDSLINITCYLTDLSEWPAMNEVYAEFFGEVGRPTRTAVGVAELPFSLKVEMAAIAVRER